MSEANPRNVEPTASTASRFARVYGRVLREARRYWWHIGGLLALSLLATPLALLTPLPVKLVVDSVLGDAPVPGFLRTVLPASAVASPDAVLLVAVGLVVLVAVGQRVRVLVKGVLKVYTGQRILLATRARLLGRAQRLSLSYHDAVGSTDSTYRIHTDAQAVKTLATGGVIPFVSAVTQLVAMITVTVAVDAQLAMVALLVTPALYLALRANVARLHGGWHGVTKMDSSIMSRTQEVLGGLRVVSAFGQEDRERDHYLRRGREKARARTRLAILENWLGLLIGTIVAIGTAAVLYVGVGNVLDGSLTLGSLLLVMGYLTQLYGPLESIAERVGTVQSAVVGAERAFELLDRAPGVPERPDARELRRAQGGIAVERVSFRYDDEVPVLREVSLRIEPGETVGISGATGAGKTTLVNLLARFFDPTEGRILLDGVDLRDFRVADLRRQFAIVLQDPLLFSTSIAENIGYARPEADRAEIEAAARAAHVHEFVETLPDGYETTVGERGMRMSGGQRQRLSLARAFLADAPIVILDEPTSAVDSATEDAIRDAIRRLTSDRTTLVIAHRASMFDLCDRVVALADGRLTRAAAP